MKIISLTAENVKRLRAVEITPDGNVQVITGKNGQGKTSVLDAIWLALGGGPAAKGTVRPIRDGETKASVRLDLGDIVVTRSWTGSGTTLKVESAEGAKFSSPQKMLDDLVGRLSFDPLAFTQMPAKAQRDALLSLVDLDVDLEALDAERAALYDQRTEVGRQGKALGDVPTVNPDLPLEEESATAILARLREAQEAHRANEAATDHLAEAERRVDELTRELEEWKARATARRVNLDALPSALPDLDHIEARLQSVEETNAAIRTNNAARERAAEADRLRAQYEEIGTSIRAKDATKSEALAAAAFPIDGLGFDEHGVTYQGVPFSQASSAEQIRVSLAMAMALNPKLRVIRILDGSLLDADNLALVSEMAADRDYQVWIERVSDGTGVGVMIEDGQVQS